MMSAAGWCPPLGYLTKCHLPSWKITSYKFLELQENLGKPPDIVPRYKILAIKLFGKEFRRGVF